MAGAIQIATTLLAFVVTVFVSQADAKELDKAAHPDDCLAAPNSSAPPGSQWRYRLERGTHRKCWYLRNSGKAPQKAAQSEKTNAATPLPASSVQPPPTTSNVTSPAGNALAAPAPLSLEPGSQTAKPIRNAGPENGSSIRTRVPQSSTPSVSQVKKVAPAPPARTEKGAADPTAMSSIRDAASASPSKPSSSHGEESAPALRAGPMINGESHDTVSDTSSGQPSTPSASSSQKLAPTPYLQLSRPTGSSTESVQEKHSPSVSSSPGNALAAPVPMSSESGTQRAKPIQNAEPDETSAIRRTPIPQSSIPSIPPGRETTPLPNLPTDDGAVDPATTSSIRDAAPASLNKASNSHAAESVPALNAPPVSSAASHDTISESSPGKTKTPSESSSEEFAPTPHIALQTSAPTGNSTEPRVPEEQTPAASLETSTSAISPLSQADTQVSKPDRKVERADRPRVAAMLNGRQQSATTLGGLPSGTSVSEIDLQKLIAIALTAVAGLVAVGMLTRAALLDRAARRKRIAEAATETTDPYYDYYDREFYRKLREGNVAQSP